MGKKILITGATRGIGWALARKAAAAGLEVVLQGRNAQILAEKKQLLDKKGTEVQISCFDVQNRSAAKKQLAKIGDIDYIINNAGIIADNWWNKMTAEQWDEVLATNLTGAFNVTSLLTPKLNKNGQIIFLTSQAGILGNAGQANYSAAKAGLIGLTYTLAEELRRDSIRVNAVSPGAVTEMTLPVLNKLRAKYKELPPEWHLGSADAVAAFIIDEVLPTCKTGTVFAVNGSKKGYWSRPQYNQL
ncbi:3-oxoacyl-[acyl-carrier protein] reductase [Liquorilactobacillus sucicola DSM 21376 = JCM 15457]|uniref:3-oxoacyl-ACP reductase n=1 Tax=Liquorilactobacillus sucicola DSM 21376 = JCM 15457 TaxID=1423806 RepID=A0A023CV30_9LACO|nr:SDR family NAD(P)-dependent oxidoreductase [Liquorilactobacillus sucicola]KRN05336.1 3-oxoacyl-ACP reductase [Liquorilactobacillus sucicola DSM 21376 = JCM 15457]GAJ25405.1 3-oxoacyl-[acyl-carrier protein] reductase [Liquorilactobacillus sucicola DSM 21376 = JCM 15457]